MSKIKPATGGSTTHATNKQNERGSGASNHPFGQRDGSVQTNKWKSKVNPNPPNVAEGRNTAPRVHPTPKINAGATGADGGKRIINSEAKPHNAKNTFTAPRSSGGGSATDLGYTKIKM